MNRYLILQKNAAGCDYSIACGKDYWIEESELGVEPFQEFIASKVIFGGEDIEDVVLDKDFIPEELIIMPLATGLMIEINIGQWVRDFEARLKNIESHETETAEKKLLEELFVKHGCPDLSRLA